MTRRELIALAACGRILRAQTKIYREYARCLPDFLRGVADDAYRRRNSELAKLTTPGAVRARQQWVAETFWKITGGKPASHPAERTHHRLIRTSGLPSGESGL